MSILQTSAKPGTGRSSALGPLTALVNKFRACLDGTPCNFRLQSILFVALILISAVPVFLLAAWVQTSAMKKEIDAVTEKHLLIAQNLSSAFERYIADIEKAFLVAATQVDAQNYRIDVDRYLKSFDFNYVSVVHHHSNVIGYHLSDADNTVAAPLPTEAGEYLKSIPTGQPGEVVFSDLMRENGQGVFYVVIALDDDQLMIGALDPAFIRKVQRSITFGERGHSMVVDAKGRVVAHPNPDWEARSKDASKLSVVQKMMRGETGVAMFYSPPMQADMIAGHTTVPGVGWGVMVPQPMSELAARARDVRNATVIVSAIGIVVASVIAWLLARLLAAPMVAVARATSAVATGSYDTRVGALPWGSPRELRVLSDGFDDMIGELQQRDIGLRTAKEQAEAANRGKTEFLANVSHELRTPLNAVIGYSSIMRDEIHGPVGAPEYSNYLRDIHDSGHHLLEIINDILDVSKIETDKLELSESEFDVSRLATACLRMVEERAKDANVETHLVLGQELPPLFADERMTKQIVLNLLSNAIKFTPEGGSVTLNVAVELTGAYRISVTDTGIGIPADRLRDVLKPFYQIDSGLDRKYNGTGLGLSLVKSMAERHGGDVAIKSTPHVGTTVSVRFPPDRTRT